MGSYIFADEVGYINIRVCGHISLFLYEVTGEDEAVLLMHHPLCCGSNLGGCTITKRILTRDPFHENMLSPSLTPL